MASSGSSSVNAPSANAIIQSIPNSHIVDNSSVLPVIESSSVIATDMFVEDLNIETSISDNSSASNMSSSTNHSNQLEFLYNENKGSFISSVYSTPGGTKHWRPIVDPKYTPIIGSVFQHWDDAVTMYTQYASKAGFSTRISTQKKKKDPYNVDRKILTHRYILCSKNGKPRFQKFDSSLPPTSNQRRSRYSVSGCCACVRFRYIESTNHFELYGFNDTHNHCMISSDSSDLLKQNRQIGFEEQQFIHKVSLNRMGPNIAHNLQVSLKGGPQHVHGTTVDFKNASRDIRLFIGDRDANLVVDTLNSRRTNLNDFFFEYMVVGNELRSLFWADFVSLRNYEAFGDVCAFDATYDTNKYRMIFVPFTGVDHHKRCVTFGAGLLYDETVDSYIWLLNMFLKAHKKQPTLVLTDQDASMKQAVSTVFNHSIHRLCMWHIMKKLPAKISSDILDNTNLRSSIHKLVWNLFISPEIFEEQWQLLLAEYHLEHHEWLNAMYNIRTDWVPCYFRDIPMCCLMKTTSRCESSNARFKVNSRESNTLVQFLMCYDTSLDAQRYMQRKMEFDSDTSTPQLQTNLPIELHAADVYTWSIFLEVQKEIQRGMLFCIPIESPTDSSESILCYTVKHLNKNMDHVNAFEVTFNINSHMVNCTCMGFTRIGYLCRHAFCIFRLHKIDRIPIHYISARWKRDAIPSSVHSLSNLYSSETNEVGTLKSVILDLITQCINRVRRAPERLQLLSDQIRSIRNEIFDEFPDEPQIKPKLANISDILNLPVHSKVTIRPPQGIRNKGSGTKRQRVGPGQKVAERRKRAARLCKKCNKYVYDHDKRNCEKVKAAKRAAYESKCAAALAANLLPPRYDVSDNEFDVEPVHSSSDSDTDNSEHPYDDTTEAKPYHTSSSIGTNEPPRRSSRHRSDHMYLESSESGDNK